MNLNKKKVVIKDIAKEAEVAISTVSFVINNKDIVKKETRERVLRAIEKLNYKPSFYARGLRTKQTRSIGVLVPNISSPFFSQVLNGIESSAREYGYNIILCCNYFDKKIEENIVLDLINHFVDGFIFINGTDNKDLIQDLFSKKIPLVLLDRDIENNKIPSVLIDYEAAMIRSIDYLCSLGHKEIGYASMPYLVRGYPVTVLKRRYDGFLKGLKKNKIKFNKNFIFIDKNFDERDFIFSEENLTYFIKNNKMPTAFLISADLSAFMFLKKLKELGFDIPNDISIIGFGNINLVKIINPGLTTVKHSKKLMGRIGIELLIKLIEKKEINEKNIILPTELIVRKTTAPPKII